MSKSCCRRCDESAFLQSGFCLECLSDFVDDTAEFCDGTRYDGVVGVLEACAELEDRDGDLHFVPTSDPWAISYWLE